MSSTDAPWWADVQQDRNDLGGRREAESWLDEEIEFVSRRRFPRAEVRELELRGHGVFVHAESAPASAREERAEVAVASPAPARESNPGPNVWDAMSAATDERPQRRTVHITGHPESRALPAPRPRRPRTASDRVGHRPDKIALWAVVLGGLLMLLALTSADSQAATHAAELLTAAP